MPFHAFSVSQADACYTALQQHNPLVHCLTNEVVQAFTANVLLAVGASPAMVVAQEEVAGFAAQADGLLINLGTLCAEQAKAMLVAIESAQAGAVPWVLDPVAVGVLAYRTDFARSVLALHPAAVRGNASEILALAKRPAKGKGMDSQDNPEAALEAAQELARQYETVVAVTGATDFINDGVDTVALHWGHPMMTRVVGTGCALSALVAACLSLPVKRLEAVAAACAVMGIAGQFAATVCQGTGTFVPAMLDALNRLPSENEEK